MQLGKMLSRAAKHGYAPAPYLANRNVQWDVVDLSELEWMDFSDVERQRFALRAGDLLVCEGGEVGRTALWSGEREGVYFQKAIHRLRARTGETLPQFMLRFMRFAVTTGALTQFTSQTSISHLTAEKLTLVPLSVPPLCEQHRIIAAFDAIDTHLNHGNAVAQKLRLLKHGLMHDLLTGRVRVPAELVSTP